MKFSWNQNCMRQPIGGHHFIVYRPITTTLRADSLDELEQELKDFRINNGFPLGDPLQDILEFYAINWPYLVNQEPGEKEEPGIRFTLWREWIQKLWKNPPKNLCPNKIAKERWETCRNCKYHKLLPGNGTEEYSELTRRAFMLRRGLDVPTTLGYCAFHAVDLGVFTMIDHPDKFSQNTKEYDECFIKKEKENDGLK